MEVSPSGGGGACKERWGAIVWALVPARACKSAKGLEGGAWPCSAEAVSSRARHPRSVGMGKAGEGV